MDTNNTPALLDWEIETLHDEAYEKYRLDFMVTHGYSLSQLANYLINYYEGKKDVYADPDLAFTDGADVLSDWAETTGFSAGDTWLGKTAFLIGPYQDEEYMKHLLSGSEDLLHQYHIDRMNDTGRKEEPYTMRLYMKSGDYAALNNDIESFVIGGIADEKEKFYGYVRTGDYAIGISSNAKLADPDRNDILPFLPICLDIYQIKPDLTQGLEYSFRSEVGQVVLQARTGFSSTHALMDQVLETVKNNISITGEAVTERNFQEAFCSKDINKYDRYHFVLDGVFPTKIDSLPMIAQRPTIKPPAMKKSR